MLSIRSSNAIKENPAFGEAKRKANEKNLAWLERNLPAGEQPCLLMVGGISPLDFRVRVAQSHARRDLTPSNWSHVALLLRGAKGKMAGARLFEISLQPKGGFGFPPETNGVQVGDAATYDDRARWPNVAIILLPAKAEDVERVLEKFKAQRSALDAVELLMAWLAFGWGVGRSPNPLVEGMGLPSATMVEYVLGGLQYELTPGLDSRSSCPEAIWQSAKWWHEYYAQTRGKKEALRGSWVVDDDIGAGFKQ